VTSLHTVDADGRYDGLSLVEALPLVVIEIVKAFDPVEVILFGSVARGDSGPDSDLDILVVLDHVERDDKRWMMREIRRSIRTFVPVDIAVTDVRSLVEDRDDVGSTVYWPIREGRSMYRRSVSPGGWRHF
jgi:uncharacterized protein